MKALSTINFAIAVVFFCCYLYQFIYLAVPWILKGKKLPETSRLHKYAVLICARNEESVIGDLVDSIREQKYPADLVQIFVMADNCDDRTADIAAEKGAIVYRRYNQSKVGKGYAMEALLKHIRADYPEGFDGYFVFDADNLLRPDYLKEMNRCFDAGNEIITSYRNSKNYGSNWISAGYALWFLRESRYLNQARCLLGTSCAVSGTGFFFSQKVLDEIGGWPFHMLTEDIEFSINQITNGRKIAFCPTAEFYDEQPVLFRQSWVQRKRWARGYLQVFRGYGAKLIKGTCKGDFSCFDMSMTIMPAFILTGLSIICNVILGVMGAIQGEDLMIAVSSIGQTVGNMYLMLFGIGLLTTVTEWKHIRAKNWKKVAYMITFPLFMFTYIPISVSALVSKTEWKPVAHTFSVRRLESKP